MSEEQTISVFGIRHHGPGSARSLVRALTALEPDCVLIEGPPDADDIIPLAAAPGMRPPVAILVHSADAPQRCAFYPFAEFSPEWQAIHFALARNLPVRFMDLPQAHQLIEQQQAPADPAGTEASEPAIEPQEIPTEETPPEETTAPDRTDPLNWLGRAAGYADGEDWWENMVEQRLDGEPLFAAIHEAMVTLRSEFPAPVAPDEAKREAMREAHMRRTIRDAEKEGFVRIAVVCGAWHAPALTAKVKVKDDNELLRGLPREKVSATWVPWTFGRLSSASGYGAGIPSPGWYDHLWQCRTADGDRETAASQVASRWLTRIARLLRDEDLDCSSAHVIEAVRLAESLAAMRERPFPGLGELDEAAQTVMCFGEMTPLQLIRRKLTVGTQLGEVPKETPTIPLQRDLEALQKSLRLKPEAYEKTIDLDLRTPTGLARSYLLHRLNLLDIPWGSIVEVGNKKGSFHEIWRIQWQPEFAVKIIEAGMWGNTVETAAANRAVDIADHASLPRLSELVNEVLLAELSAAVEPIMQRLDDEAALSNDVSQLMGAVPPLSNACRYGNVRKTDTGMIRRVIDGLVIRICVGLAPACSSLDDEAAQRMAGAVAELDASLRLIEDEEHTAAWQRTLRGLAEYGGINRFLAGRCCRLLLDAGVMEGPELGTLMSLALSRGNDPAEAAGWLEGFLTGSGMVLLHDDRLWSLLDEWVSELGEEAFVSVLPLVRRTFATFSSAERRQMGLRVKAGQRGASPVNENCGDVNHERGELVLPLVRQLLGLEGEA